MRPLHPSLIAAIPMRYTAKIVTHDGWWFRYVVHSTNGIFISTSLHRTLRGAERAALRWTRRNDRAAPVVVERHS